MNDRGHADKQEQAQGPDAGMSGFSFPGGGQMGTLVCAFDWSRTPLGPLSRWPVSLKTIVSTLLNSRQPMFLWWGPELIQIYNDAYVPSFGVGKHPAALGQPGRACWPEIWHIIGPEIEAVMTEGRASWHEDALVPIFRNGAIEPVYWTYGYSPAFDDDGRIAGTLVVCSETTESVLGRRAAEVANRAKDDFLTTASHELRTPLTAILGWVRLLRRGQLDPSGYLRAIETIERNAKVQVRLIEDILDGSRVITGKLHLEIRVLDMTAVVHAAIDALRPAAEAKRIRLSVEADPAAARIVGDPDRLQQVVWNLVNNAIKFTPKGGGVDVSLRRAGADIELRVVDSGQGISGEFLPHVFERFRQAEGSTTRRHGGLGLGLALVRHLVEAHGGVVRAESAGVDRGATFTVTLPVQAVFPEPAGDDRKSLAPAVDEARQAPSLADVTVLVVDDEADARDLVSTVLRQGGAQVTTATHAAAALALLAHNTYTVMVSDVGMPDTDGYTLIRQVRRMLGARGAQLPAVALTAYAREEDRRLAVEAGFDAHVAKPVEPDVLVNLVAALARDAAGALEPLGPASSYERADTFGKFERILSRDGLHRALRFLNSRTPHRFTAIYRFDPPLLRSVELCDAEVAAVRIGDDSPLEETYCSIVGAAEQSFTTEDARRDDRLREHPARNTIVSYCGVLLRRQDGTPFGTLCHFDLIACDVPFQEVGLMEAVARRIMQHLETPTAPPVAAG
jgi:signal transduction histidine kinase/CheY-like chemotaxis protein